MSTVETGVIQSGDILIVDDTLDNLKLLMDILGGAGFHARPAGDGELALLSARAKPPALVLLDILMPTMDGFEVCRRLKQDEHTRDIPVIFLSGMAETANKAKGFALGAVDYITKPFQEEEVLARVRLHLALAAAKEQLRIKNQLLQQANEQLTAEIAERAQAQEALRESRDRLRDIYQTVGDGIISIDAQQRIVLLNAAAERIFGYSAAEMTGQPLSLLLPERFRAAHAEHIRRFDESAQSNRTPGTYRLIYGLRASGEEFPVEAAVSQSGVSPNKLFTVILRDITERRQAEQAREELMRQLELLSERLATAQEEERHKIAYELHEELAQELAALNLYLQIIGPGADGKAKAPRDEALALAVHATERVRNLVMNLEPPEMTTFGLQAAACSYCERQAREGGLRLHMDAPKTEVRAPRLVERACFRVLQEGLDNVLRHAKASDVWVDLHHGTDTLELKIRDNGSGFDRNGVREDSTREGRGLGLFGMQIRAKQVGGSVQVMSSPGAGTEVRAAFPLLAAPVEPGRS